LERELRPRLRGTSSSGFSLPPRAGCPGGIVTGAFIGRLKLTTTPSPLLCERTIQFSRTEAEKESSESGSKSLEAQPFCVNLKPVEAATFSGLQAREVSVALAILDRRVPDRFFSTTCPAVETCENRVVSNRADFSANAVATA
jgi:hypothetical protein